MITICDYGTGNIGSLINLCRHIGADARVADTLDEVRRAGRLVLPGVGSFDAAMRKFDAFDGLRDVLLEKATIEHVPLLGVCLGMQMLTDASEEGGMRGLGLIAGRTRRLPSLPGLRVPHMGWNTATPKGAHPLVADTYWRFYFVHSFVVEPADPEDTILITDYGVPFASAIARQNIVGVQFHPEKSHRYGMELVRRFARWAP